MSASTKTLVAGRELDALIAERVFGPWDESRCRVCGWPLVPDGERGCWHDNCSMRYSNDSSFRIARADEPRPYSTDIAAAWEVVAALRSRNNDFTLHDDGGYGNWVARFQGFAVGIATTAPHAICLAALKAVTA